MAEGVRIDRLLSLLALGTRGQAKSMVKAGRVEISGETVTDASQYAPAGATVLLDGHNIDTRLERHVLMNKPAGLLTAARDSRQKTVMDLLPPVYAGLKCMPVGRLDKDTEGLLILTTDGQLAHRLLSPKQDVAKVYRAKVTGRLDTGTVQRFREGIVFKEFVSLPAKLEIEETTSDTSIATVSVREGKFHQVKRMFSACGHEVLFLKRLSFGPIVLDENSAPGEWREMRDDEINRLKEAANIG